MKNQKLISIHPKQAVIFDLFDTLLQVKQTNFNSGLYLLWQRYFSRASCFEKMMAYSNALYPIMKQHQKTGREFSFRAHFITAFCEYFDVLPFQLSIEEEAEIITAISQCSIYPETFTVLKKLKEKRIYVYILSNSIFSSASLTYFLQQHGLNDEIEMVFSSADLTWRKPSPQIFEACIQKIFHIQPTLSKNDILFIGNSYTCDANGGVSACLETVWLNVAQETNEENLPIHIIQNLSEILTLDL